MKKKRQLETLPCMEKGCEALYQGPYAASQLARHHSQVHPNSKMDKAEALKRSRSTAAALTSSDLSDQTPHEADGDTHVNGMQILEITKIPVGEMDHIEAGIQASRKIITDLEEKLAGAALLEKQLEMERFKLDGLLALNSSILQKKEEIAEKSLAGLSLNLQSHSARTHHQGGTQPE